MNQITTKEFIKIFKIISKWSCTTRCLKTFYGMKKGDEYTENLTVYKIRKIRRVWDEPGTEIILETPIPGNENKMGYVTINSNVLDESKITVDENNVVTVTYYEDNKPYLKKIYTPQ